MFVADLHESKRHECICSTLNRNDPHSPSLQMDFTLFADRSQIDSFQGEMV